MSRGQRFLYNSAPIFISVIVHNSFENAFLFSSRFQLALHVLGGMSDICRQIQAFGEFFDWRGQGRGRKGGDKVRRLFSKSHSEKGRDNGSI